MGGGTLDAVVLCVLIKYLSDNDLDYLFSCSIALSRSGEVKTRYKSNLLIPAKIPLVRNDDQAN